MAKSGDSGKNNIKEFRIAQWIMCVAVFAILLIPFIAMPWASSDSSSENRELASIPSVHDETGEFNIGLLGDMGDYFADHFAFRSELVDLDARLYSSLFGVSTTDQVIVGDDDWLYYAGTLNDYQARSPLRERQARNIAYNLRMMQDYCAAQGASFVFAVAPNKNSLYGNAMPYYYLAEDDDSMALLEEQLQKHGVNHVDLFSVFEDQNSLLYFLRDSHWNEKGALLAQDELLQAAGKQVLSIGEDQLIASDSYIGDLNEMIFPVSAVPEMNWYVDGINDGSGDSGGFRSGSLWEYVEGSSTEDDVVETASDTDVGQENGSLLMYRDSFANNLIPYMAVEFDSAMFTKMVPYNALLVAEEKPGTVFVERTQRHVDYLSENAPIMPCPTARHAAGSERQASDGVSASCEMGENGPLVSFSGFVDGYSGGADIRSSSDDQVFVRITGSDGDMRVYRAFAITDSESDNDWGYNVYASKSFWQGQTVKVEVLVGAAESYMSVGEFDFVVE